LQAQNNNNEFPFIRMEDKGSRSVTASRWEQSIYEIPASTVVITRAEIEQNGYISLQEILENVPGLYTIDHRYTSGVTIGIRGFWTDFSRNVMIQLNGVNMLNERRNDFPFDKINVAVESIDKIEIVRGPMSVIYGAGAFFGVINIITNDVHERASNSINSSYGSQNTFRETFRYASNENGVNLSFNAMLFQRDGFTENWRDMIDSNYAKTDSMATTVDSIGFADAVTAYDYYRDNGAVNPERYSRKFTSLNFSLDYEGFFVNLNYAKSNTGFSFKQPGPGQRNDYKTSTANYQIGYMGELRQLGNGLDWQFKFDYMHSRGDQISNLYVDSIYVLGEDRVSSYRSELNARYPIYPARGLKTRFSADVLGGIYYNNNFENGSFYNAPEQYKYNWYVGLDDDASVQTHAGYLQSEFKFDSLGNNKKGALQIILGLRGTKESAYNMHHAYNQDFYELLTLPDLGFEEQTTPSTLIDTEFRAEKKANPISWLPRLAMLYNLKGDNDFDNYFKLMFGKAVNEINVVRNAFDRMTPGLIRGEAPAEIIYLKPERISTYEFGHTLVNERKGFELNTNVFLNMMDGLITRQTSNGNTSAESFNDSTRLVTRGVELIGKYFFTTKNDSSKFFFHAGLTLQSTVRLADDEKGNLSKYFSDEQFHKDTTNNPISFSPQVLFNLNIGYLKTMNFGKFSARIGTNYVGKMASQKNNGKFIDNNMAAAYFRPFVNIRLSDIKPENLKNGGFFFNLKVSNFTNTTYAYPTVDGAVWASNKGVLGRSRQTIGTIGFKF
jgi:outer membrane receptor protein involved in Fe transport